MPFRYLRETQQVFSGNATCYSQKRMHRNAPPSSSHSSDTGTQYPSDCFSSYVAGSDKGRGVGWEFSTYCFHTWISSYLLHCSVHKIYAETSLFLITTSAAHSPGRVLTVCQNHCTALPSSSSSPQYLQRYWSGKPHFFFPININSV